MNRGEVWWVRTRSGRRPYLVLTRQSVAPLLGKLVAVPATSRRRGLPSELELDEDDGMPRACVLSFDNVDLVSKRRFVERICVLGDERMSEACRRLGIATGCIA